MKHYLMNVAMLLSGVLLLSTCKKEPLKTEPVVSISTISNVTDNSASCLGNVSADGGASVTSRGICYSATNPTPTTSDGNAGSGSGIGSFSGSLTGLTAGTTYNVRAYAANSVGTAYSSALTFKTLALAPVITTIDLSAITSTTATSGGNITNDGGSPVTARGVCWSTNQNPTTADSKTSDGAGNGTFSSALTALAPGTTYYIRAYATNSIGIAYGNQVTTTTLTSLPILTTTAISVVTYNSATSGGNISSDGGIAVTARGACWSTSQNPTIADNKTSNGTGTGSYTSSITGLKPNTNYFVRAYATNSLGTAYGTNISFTSATIPLGTVIDVDGNLYATVTIGTQVWMKENLKVTRLNDETSIELVTDNSKWNALSTPGYCWYNNDESTNKNTYGALYNWEAVNTGKLCPAGWHMPSHDEYILLADYLGGSNIAGVQLREAGTLHWASPNTGATNGSGFSGLPGGGRSSTDVSFTDIGSAGYWWSSTEYSATQSWGLGLGFDYIYACNCWSYKKGGGSIRCVKGDYTYPILTTSSISNITTSSAVSGGTISGDGGTPVAARGVCWNTASFQLPTISNSKTTNGAGTGTFASTITGLAPGTEYYIRAYATSSVGTAYGGWLTFTTSDLPVKTINYLPDGLGYLQYYTNDNGNCSTSGGKGYYFVNAANYTSFHSVETEIIKNSGSSYMYGVMFCYTDTYNYYRFLIDTDGYYDILKVVSGVPSWYNFSTKSWQANNTMDYPKSAHVNRGFGVSNKIKVIATGGGNFDLYFNGSKDASFTDLTFTGGKTGFASFLGPTTYENFPNTPLDTRFKELSAN